MGGDGGNTATERKYLRGAKVVAAATESKNMKYTQMIRARSCALSSEPLRPNEPIVCCELGHLYNKESILTALLDNTSSLAARLASDFPHIKRLKDIKELKLCASSSASAANTNSSDSSRSGIIETETSLLARELSHGGTTGTTSLSFCCPLGGTQFNGIIPFIALWSTGYVLSEKAFRELGAAALQGDYGPFSTGDVAGAAGEIGRVVGIGGDVVRIMPCTADEKALAVANMLARKARTQSTDDKSKGKKKKYKETEMEKDKEGGRKRENEGEGERDASKRKHAEHSTHNSASVTAITIAGSDGDISTNGAIVREVLQRTQQQQQEGKSSAAFRSIFHTGPSPGATGAGEANDLFIQSRGKGL